jgi:hypothetical protein
MKTYCYLSCLSAAAVSVTTSTANVLVLTLLHGRELGWVCLGSCGADVSGPGQCQLPFCVRHVMCGAAKRSFSLTHTLLHTVNTQNYAYSIIYALV